MAFQPKNIDIVAPILTEVLAERQLPPTFNVTVIMVLLKNGKNPYEPRSFWPISLENIDYKILTKVLAMRMQNILPQIIMTRSIFIQG